MARVADFKPATRNTNKHTVCGLDTMAEPVTFPAQVVKVQTLADSGLRLTLDLPESEIIAFAWLAQCKRAGVVLDVTCQPLINNEKQDNDIQAGGIGQPEGQAKDAGTVRTFAGRGKQDYRGRRQAVRG